MAGNDTEFIYNDVGSANGSAYFTYNQASGRVYANANIASIGTGSGTVVVVGGLGVSGNINAGNVIGGGVRTTTSNTAPSNPTAGDIWYEISTDKVYRYTYDGTSSYWVDLYGLGYASEAGIIGATGATGYYDGSTNLALTTSNTDISTSTTTGALIIPGGGGIAGNLNVGETIYVTGDILPTTNITSNLGSPTFRFNTLFVASSTIDLGGTTLSADSSGLIQITTPQGNVVILNVPRISSIDYPGDDTAADPAGGQIVYIDGSGFQTGIVVYLDGSAVGTTTLISSTRLSFITPAKASGNYSLSIVNTDGGTATSLNNIQYSGVPTWSTSSGSLGTVYETQNFNYNLSATSDSAVTYELTSGSIPGGATLYTANGGIRGSANAVEGSTTSSFTIDAVDLEEQNTSRNFSITVLPDSVTWVTPSSSTTTVTQNQGNVYSLTLDASSGSNNNITFTANTLPTGISLVGNTISGTLSSAGNSSTLITATISTTNRIGTRIIDWIVNADVVTWITPSSDTTVTQYEYTNYTITLNATSSFGSSITYSANSWPTGITLTGNTANGTLTSSGNVSTLVTATSDESGTAESKVINFVVQPDAVTWTTPSSATTNISQYEQTSYTLTLDAASAAGRSITFTTNTLPTGLTLSTNTISGTLSSPGTVSTLVTGTTAVTNRSNTRVLNFTVTQDSISWTTPSSNVTVTQYEQTSYLLTLSASSAAGRAVTYAANSLPTGLTLSSGTISGTLSTVANTTTLLTATAATTNRTGTRQIQFNVQQDVVTWSSPSSGQSYSYTEGDSVSIPLSATSAAGRSITYSVSGQPSGVSVSGSNLTGTISGTGSFTLTLTATAATTGRSATRTISFSVASAVTEATYTSAGTYSFTVPGGVTAISAVAVGSGHMGVRSSSGGGGGGPGGSLRWSSSIAVTPGETLTVFVGAARVAPSVNSFDTYFTASGKGQSSYIARGGTILLRGAGGGLSDSVGEGGGNGGSLQGFPTYPLQESGIASGGGGAGGYSGDGGRGAIALNYYDSTDGSGGGGGGGGASTIAGGGGGVGIYGAGASGTRGTSLGYSGSGNRGTAATGGSGGSSGQAVWSGGSYPNPSNARAQGGAYGGGAGGLGYTDLGATGNPTSGGGAVRIVWGGRSYPNNAA